MKKPKFWQTQTFKEIEDYWYGQLERFGFKDAEKTINGNSVLKQSASNSYRNAKQVERDAKLAYYSLLQGHCNQEAFQDDIEKLVIERRADGFKIKQICEELRSLNERSHRETVRKIIVKYELKWGIKKK